MQEARFQGCEHADELREVRVMLHAFPGERAEANGKRVNFLGLPVNHFHVAQMGAAAVKPSHPWPEPRIDFPVFSESGLEKAG
jgi:hypothetical protein